jgi:hypothetical protein
MTASICPHHSDNDPPKMCACAQRTLEASRRMDEIRDCMIAALESMLATAVKPEDKAWASAIDRNPRAMLDHSRNERIVAAKAALAIE